LKKFTKAQIQPITNCIADQFPCWKADLMTKVRRKVQVLVLTVMLIYLVMAFDFPPWAINVVDKIQRGFLWRGRKDAKGGHCMVA
jgi:hypothetical protein